MHPILKLSIFSSFFLRPSKGTFPIILGKDEPVAPTLHIKPKDPKSFLTPAPGAYNPDAADKDVKLSAPKYSFGIKTKDGKPREVPAPNAYTISKTKDAPSYSLASRPKDAKKYVTPSPGAYESCDTNQYRQKAPSFSLSTRYNVPSDTSLKPGPGAYMPEKVWVFKMFFAYY